MLPLTLCKSLHRSKQNLRAWFEKFSQVIENFRMRRASHHFLFYKRFESGVILLVVYMDDIVITSDDTLGIQSFKTFLHNQLLTKDLGMLEYFLRIEVIRNKGILLLHRKCALDLLTAIGKLGAKPCSTAVTPNLQSRKRAITKRP